MFRFIKDKRNHDLALAILFFGTEAFRFGSKLLDFLSMVINYPTHRASKV